MPGSPLIDALFFQEPMVERLRDNAPSEILELFAALGGEVETAIADRKQFLAKLLNFMRLPVADNAYMRP